MSEDSLEDKALALIKSHPNGILQSELWKGLGIDSRKCSRVIAKLEADGKIKRTWETVKGTRTYRISYLPQKKEAPRKEVDFRLIMADERVAPCIGCTYECEPDYCPDLGNWIELLARSPISEAPRVEKAPVPKVSEPEEEAEAEEEVAAPKGKKAGKAVKAAKPAKEVKAAKPTKEEKATRPVKEVKAAKKVAAPKIVAAKKSAKPAKEPPARPSKAAKSTKSTKAGKK